jgi:hypothetical protein
MDPQEETSMDKQKKHTSAPGNHRGIGAVAAASLVLVLSAMGIRAAFGGRNAAEAATHPSPIASAVPAAESPSHRPSPEPPSPTLEPRPTDPNALANGTYPTYVVGVDVNDATITVDVLQTFFGGAAHRAASQDGVSWKDVRYAPVYIRNENDLLRALPVDRDVRVKLIGECEASSRTVGLKELRDAALPFTQPSTFYYEVSVADGSVVGITQMIALSAC